MKRKHFISAIVIASLLSPLSWAYTGGSGTPDDPYQITAVADWQQLMATSNDWDKHFILTADLDLQGVALTPVGISWNSPFTGTFDGQGFKVRNAAIVLPDTDFVGLFGYLGAGGELRDLGAEDVNITGRDYVGGLVSRNYGTLTSCYATGHVTGDYRVGGLVGDNRGTLTSCYAAGDVNGTGDDVGGLVGFFNGYWGTIAACFWDVETSGTSDGVGNEHPDPAGVTGKTTAQMKDINTFLDAGWDFVGEDDNGNEDIWRMCVNGVHYPKLWWEFAAGDFDCPDGVDFVDFATFSRAWLSDNTPTSNWNPACDISQPPDGIIDERDLAAFCGNWLAGR